MSAGPSCAGCIFYRRVRDVGMRCCRRAPVVATRGGVETVWPAPLPDQWCGEFKPRDGES